MAKLSQVRVHQACPAQMVKRGEARGSQHSVMGGHSGMMQAIYFTLKPVWPN
jgi:hypothetical protein